MEENGGKHSKRHKHGGTRPKHNKTAYMGEDQWSKLTHPKYMMYSTHDTQLGIVWEFLDPVNYDPLYIPYASFIQMELYKDEKCKEDAKNTDKCFYMMFTMNGKELMLNTDKCKNRTMCPYSVAREYL